MSKTRALATVKSLEAKIRKLAESVRYQYLTQGTEARKVVVGSATSESELVAQTKKDFESLMDMMNTRDSIKAALIQSNAETKVVIGAKTMTVAEAIEAKRSIELRCQALANMRKQFANMSNQFTRAQADYDKRAEDIQDGLSGRDKKVSEEELKMRIALLEGERKPGLLDPLDLASLIRNMDEEIQDFLTNVDFALSESNASTFIEI